MPTDVDGCVEVDSDSELDGKVTVALLDVDSVAAVASLSFGGSGYKIDESRFIVYQYLLYYLNTSFSSIKNSKTALFSISASLSTSKKIVHFIFHLQHYFTTITFNFVSEFLPDSLSQDSLVILRRFTWSVVKPCLGVNHGIVSLRVSFH